MAMSTKVELGGDRPNQALARQLATSNSTKGRKIPPIRANIQSGAVRALGIFTLPRRAWQLKTGATRLSNQTLESNPTLAINFKKRSEAKKTTICTVAISPA
jgi:hypothetical protein